MRNEPGRDNGVMNFRHLTHDGDTGTCVSGTKESTGTTRMERYMGTESSEINSPERSNPRRD